MRASRSRPHPYPLLLRLATSLLSVAALLLSACASPAPQLTPALRQSLTPTLNAAQLQTRVAAGFTPTPLPSATPWPVSTPTSAPAISLLNFADTNPLTGLRAQNPDLLAYRPLLVKLANWPREERPQAGLNQADIVFEYYIGFQQNHLVALYYGQDSASIAPLAPARITDARITEHFQGLLAYASSPTNVEDVLEGALAQRLFSRGFAPCPGICTFTANERQMTSVDSSILRALYSQQSLNAYPPDLAGLSFAAEEASGDEIALNLSYLYADFAVMDWRYDPLSGQYQLWQDYADDVGKIGLKQSFSLEDATPIAFDNVLILFATYAEYSPVMYDIDFRDGDMQQPALLLRDGTLSYAFWGAEDAFSPIQIRTQDGLPLPLKPGRTWVSFASINTETTQLSPGYWELFFSIR